MKNLHLIMYCICTAQCIAFYFVGLKCLLFCFTPFDPRNKQGNSLSARYGSGNLATAEEVSKLQRSLPKSAAGLCKEGQLSPKTRSNTHE